MSPRLTSLPSVPLDALLEAAPDALVVTDPTGLIVLVNEQTEALFGYPRGELLGKPVDMLVPEAARSAHEGHRAGFAEAPSRRPMGVGRELRGARRDGSEVPVEISLSPLSTSAGDFVVAMVRDVSERRLAEALGARALQQQAVVELGQLALAEDVRLDVVLERAVAVVAEHVGVTYAGLVEQLEDGVRIHATVGWGIPAGVRGEPLPEGSPAEQALRSGQTIVGTFDDEIARTAPLGPMVSGVCVPVAGHDGLFGVLTVGDVELRSYSDTEQRFVQQVANVVGAVLDRERGRRALADSHAQLRGLLENTPAIVCVKDLEGRYIAGNPTFERLIGLHDRAWHGLDDFALFPYDEAVMLHEHDAEVRADGVARFYEERVVVGGRTMTYLSAKFPMHDRDGQVNGVGLVSTDITERIEAQQVREELEQRLHRVERLDSLGRLAGGVAHDFNNLLAVIANYTQFVIDDLPEDSQGREDLEQVGRAVERARSLTGQLLIFGRRETAAAQVVDLNEVVHETEQLLRRTLGEHVRLVVELHPGRLPVHLDPGQIEQVLINLALNGRDAMPDGGVLAVSTSIAGATAEMCVTDTGTGMTPEVRDRAFEPFFTSKPKDKGTGLGLAMAYGVATRAGGTIELDTREGEGTTVRVKLPLSTSAEVLPAPLRQAGAASGETVLVVEDELAVRKLTTRLLRGHGYEVIEVPDAAAALELLASGERAVDLLLTDVVMPGMSGGRLVERLREAGSDVAVLFMSGYAGDDLVALDEDIPLLPKPFEREELLRAVRTRLDERPTA